MQIKEAETQLKPEGPCVQASGEALAGVQEAVRAARAESARRLSALQVQTLPHIHQCQTITKQQYMLRRMCRTRLVKSLPHPC